MKKKCAVILLVLITLTNVCYSYANGGIEYLKEQNIDQWGIFALYSSGENLQNMSLKKPETNITTDYESYIVGALCKGDYPKEEVQKLIDTQMANGKFSDYTDKDSSDLINSHIWGVISLYLAGREDYNKEKALNWLKENQLADGGFPVYSGDSYNDLDLTAMGLIAYSILGVDNSSSKIQDGIKYIEDNIDTEETCETVSWYIIARRFLGLEVEKELFNRLLEYKLSDGTYKHTLAYNKNNYIATYSGIAAYNDYKRDTSILQQIHYVNSFKDLKENMEELDSIVYLMEKGIISGYPNGTFKPDNSVKRSEFAKMLVYGLNKQNIRYENNVFKDMNTHWARDTVNIAYKENLINGVGDNMFAPEEKITGAQLAAILVRAKGYGDISKLYKGDTWYYGYVEVAKKFDLVYENFNPEKNATRAQCAQSIFKLISN